MTDVVYKPRKSNIDVSYPCFGTRKLSYANYSIYLYNRRNQACEQLKDVPIFKCYRPNPLGNPFHLRIDTKGAREKCIKQFGEYFSDKMVNDLHYRALVHKILDVLLDNKEVVLECYCVPLACHTEIIAMYLLNKLTEEIDYVDRNRGNSTSF